MSISVRSLVVRPAALAGLLAAVLVVLSAMPAAAGAGQAAHRQRLGQPGVSVQWYTVPVPTDNGVVALSGLAFDQTDHSWWTVTDDGSGAGFPLRLVHFRYNPSGVRILGNYRIQDEYGLPLDGSRLDPEGIVLAPDGTFWVVDESGPWVVQMDRKGRILRWVEAPAKFQGRQSGRGFEGVEISADGRTLYIMLQTGLPAEGDPLQTYIITYGIETGTWDWFAYRLDDPAAASYPPGTNVFVGASGLARTADGSLLVIERDNQAAPRSRIKRIYKVQVPDGPQAGPLPKTLVLDLLALDYPHEKVEGIAVLDRHHLVLLNDNDGDPANVTEVWHIWLARI